MKILTLQDYDQLEKVDVRNLQQLIDEGKIIAFKRASGWVKIGCEPIRGAGGPDYDGPERREYRQRESAAADKGVALCSLTPDNWSD